MRSTKLHAYECQKHRAPPPAPKKKEQDASPRRRRGVSPDGKWTAVVKDHNLHVREQDGGKEFALSKDANADDSYAAAR